MSIQTNFIETIAPIIQAEAKKRGYGCVSAIIAQACLEGNWGRSSLASIYHNHFGMKCGSSWKGKSVNMKTKEEYTVGTLTSIRDNFRAYTSDVEGIRGYFDFISTNRYAKVRQCKDPYSYLTALKNAGYATSSTYVKNTYSIVTKYNLTKYDNGELTYTNKDIQKRLNELGYNLVVDGIIGNKTRTAIMEALK